MSRCGKRCARRRPFRLCNTAFVSYKSRVWLLILLLVVICGGSVWGVAHFRMRSLDNVHTWLLRLPRKDAVLAYIDFAALRQSGILRLISNASTAEPEYRAFIGKTGFDYGRDLDAALASFTPSGKYFMLRGRFDWRRLEEYATSQGGRCLYTFCSLNGSTPERKISYFPLQRTLMGLAVSTRSNAAQDLQQDSAIAQNFHPPEKPLWVYLPGSMLKGAQPLPEGTRMFASLLENAENVLLTLAPRDAGFETGLEVQCRSARDAVALAGQLTQTTTMLREMIAREHQTPNPRDLSGVLTSGVFQSTGTRVLGSWPIHREFFESLMAGAGQ